VRQETGPNAAPARPRRAAAALLALVAALGAAFAASALARRDEDARFNVVGRARWIWCARAGRQPRPVRFVAVREIVLSSTPRRAEARLLVEPEFVLRVNGRTAATGRSGPEGPLTVVNVAPLLQAGDNRIEIETASVDGIGGILFAVVGDGLDYDAFASDGRWRIFTSAEDVGRGPGSKPIVWGRPPQYPWRYPRLPATGGGV
jgi:hypothetical protein